MTILQQREVCVAESGGHARLLVPEMAEPSASPQARRVLMLTYYFPPDQAAAMHRPDALYKWLHAFGWTPYVVTVARPGTADDVLQTRDTSWTGAVAQGRTVTARMQKQHKRRIDHGRFAKWIRRAKNLLRHLPPWHDDYAGWSYRILGEAIAHGRRNQVDAVWATCCPFSLTPVAVQVARALHVPCVVDLQDALPEYLHYTKPANHWFYRAIRHVDEVMLAGPYCASPELLEARDGRDACYTSVMGCWQTERVPARPSDKFRFIHAAQPTTVHREYDLLFAALERLCADIPEFRQDARVCLIGPDGYWIAEEPYATPFRDMIELYEQMPYCEVQEHMAESSLLLIFKGAGDEESRNLLPTKFLDYMAYESPVLALGGISGLLGDLLTWSQCGKWVGTAHDAVEYIAPLYQHWKQQRVLRVPRNSAACDYLTEYRMAGETAEILNAVVEQRPVRCCGTAPWQCE